MMAAKLIILNDRKLSEESTSFLSTSCDSFEIRSEERKSLKVSSITFESMKSKRLFQFYLKTEMCKNWTLNGNCPFGRKVLRKLSVLLPMEKMN